MKTTARQIKPTPRNPKAKPVAVDAREHRVFYRATQVERSAPCYQRPALRVGMRVAILENRNEFTGVAPKPEFYEAVVEQIGEGLNPLVAFQYVCHPYCAGLSCGMDWIAQFCVILKKPKSGRRGKEVSDAD